MFAKLTEYLKEVKTEMTKVTWPSREELADSTKVVIVISLIFAVFIFSVDRVLNKVIGIVLSMK